MRIFFSLICLILFVSNISADDNVNFPPPPDFYHRYDEMIDAIDDWVDEFPDLVRKEHIGYSQEDNIPIYAVKISHNVHEQEDKPSLLFIGSLHAEEIIGNEIVMTHMGQIINRRHQYPYNVWLNDLQLWFIPNLNPEGLQVVMDGWDITYRKNKRDNTGCGNFIFQPGEGYDKDGVDLNRNFPFNWVHGDTLFQTGSYEEFDYYRGPGPGSEAEFQALKNLTDQYHFVFSIVWHSSRTGNFAEQVFYPHLWRGHRQSPDFQLSQNIGVNVASLIPNFSGQGHYQPIASTGRNGNAHDWFYKEYGTINLLIEAGTSNLQPSNQNDLETIIEDCLNGQEWLINRALNLHMPDISSAMLTGHITDATTGEPIQAEVIVEGFHADYFTPRVSDELYGRYWRPLLSSQGPYNIIVRKKGYETQTAENVVINDSSWRIRNFALEPLPSSTFYGNIHSNGNPLDAEIVLFDVVNDTIQVVNGDFIFETHSGERKIWITAEGYFPYTGSINIQPGEHSIDVNLSPENVLFHEDWELPNCNWHINGPWQIISENSYSGNAITDSWGGRGFYAPNANVHIQTIAPLNLNLDNAYLSFWQHLYTEWGYDFVFVEVSEDEQEWQTLYKKSGQFDYWHRILINLEDFLGTEVFLRFRLTADSPHEDLVDPGWTIDEIKLIQGNSELVSTEDITVIPVNENIELGQNYPNPFNPVTIINFNIPDFIEGERFILIYNIKGQQIKKIELDDASIKRGSVVWNASENASGIYFYQLKIDNSVISTRKAVLIK